MYDIKKQAEKTLDEKGIRRENFEVLESKVPCVYEGAEVRLKIQFHGISRPEVIDNLKEIYFDKFYLTNQSCTGKNNSQGQLIAATFSAKLNPVSLPELVESEDISEEMAPTPAPIEEDAQVCIIPPEKVAEFDTVEDVVEAFGGTMVGSIPVNFSEDAPEGKEKKGSPRTTKRRRKKSINLNEEV